MANAPEATSDGTPTEGDIVAGKYRVERVIGRGGMGVVVAAQHLALKQPVAMKFLLPEAMKRSGTVERFLREAKAAVSIKNDHIARVLDVGTVDGTGAPFLVMEYLVGSDLGDVIRERGKIPVSDAVDWLLQACEVIAEAHALGIIHRDLKPANLFVTTRSDGATFIKVLDFGLSKITKTEQLEASLTQANQVMGSPYYMSPEQVRGLKGIDARADVWSLGVILHHMIAGERPFDSESLGGLFLAIGAEPPSSLREKVPEVPPALEAAILKCLEKTASARMQTIADLARAIAPFGSDEGRRSLDRILQLSTTADQRAALTSDADISELSLAETAKGDFIVDPKTFPPELAAVAPQGGTTPLPAGMLPPRAAGSQPSIATPMGGPPSPALAPNAYYPARPMSPSEVAKGTTGEGMSNTVGDLQRVGSTTGHHDSPSRRGRPVVLAVLAAAAAIGALGGFAALKIQGSSADGHANGAESASAPAMSVSAPVPASASAPPPVIESASPPPSASAVPAPSASAKKPKLPRRPLPPLLPQRNR